MATTVREFSLDYYLLDRLRFSGIDKENLADLVSILVSLKNKYGITPFAITTYGHPLPNGLTARFILETITLNKVMNFLLDTPRLHTLAVSPRGFPRSSQYEVAITLGG